MKEGGEGTRKTSTHTLLKKKHVNCYFTFSFEELKTAFTRDVILLSTVVVSVVVFFFFWLAVPFCKEHTHTHNHSIPTFSHTHAHTPFSINMKIIIQKKRQKEITTFYSLSNAVWVNDGGVTFSTPDDGQPPVFNHAADTSGSPTGRSSVVS